MTISQQTLADIEDAFGTGGRSGDAAPNGHNFLGALNSVNRIATDMAEYDLAIDDLPAEKADEYEQAHEDLQYYIKALSHLFPEDLATQDSSYELPDGTVVPLPLSATPADGSQTQLPPRP